MVGGLIAANSSTILTHLNWGASYLVHDFYRRFLQPGRDRKALRAGGPAGHGSALRALLRAGLRAAIPRRTASTSSCRSARAPGLLYLLRWFWWRITAWCEIVAMLSSFAISIALPGSGDERRGRGYGPATADDGHSDHDLLARDRLPGPPNGSRDSSVEFYRKVRRSDRAGGACGCWRVSRRPSGRWARTDNIPLALLGWFAGSRTDLVGAVHGR